MALLTEHDVLHKKFQPSKFRQEGYNPDEVDDFLDEVADTIRALTLENESLKKGVALAPAAEGDNAEVARLQAENAALQEKLATANSESADTGAAVAQVEQLRARVAQLDEQLKNTRGELEEARKAQTAALANANTGGDGAEAATGMLALAQRLHDEYVSNGKQEGERIVADATSEGERIVREAEDKHARILKALEEEKGKLEEKINELRNFEGDYRGRLTDYLNRLLEDLRNGSQG